MSWSKPTATFGAGGAHPPPRVPRGPPECCGHQASLVLCGVVGGGLGERGVVLLCWVTRALGRRGGAGGRVELGGLRDRGPAL